MHFFEGTEEKERERKKEEKREGCENKRNEKKKKRRNGDGNRSDRCSPTNPFPVLLSPFFSSVTAPMISLSCTLWSTFN